MVRVTSDAHPAIVALRIQEAMATAGRVVVQVIGAGALNQAIKALAVARRETGRNLGAFPDFGEIDGDAGGRITCLRIEVFDVGDLPPVSVAHSDNRGVDFGAG
jgi:stage V sporulation protein S